MIRAIVFDCFGVLVSDALQVIHDELKAHDPESAREVTDLVRASNRGMLDPEASNRKIASLLGLSFEDYQHKIRDGETKNLNVMNLIRSLRKEYKTAVLSNISATGLAKRFSSEELEECFDTVVSSGEIGYAKPEPEAYEITAERLSVRLDECIFIDDRIEFCEAAQAVGMKTIEYRNFEQLKTELNKLLAQN